MLKPNSYKKQKSRAQTMVEFALALPILLTLLYGLMETGRLLFIYGSTITAARQAVRYGSATGFAADGFTPLYADCVGIRAAAQKVGFINRFEDADIIITYDAGVDNGGTSIPLDPADPPCGDYTETEVENGHRILVTVSTEWEPIVPLLPLKPFTITSTSERTILNSIDIYSPTPIGGYGGSGAGKPILNTVVANPTTFDEFEQPILYTYSLVNDSPLGTLTNPGVVDDYVTVDCGVADIAPLATYTCTGTYLIQQADLDRGFITNLAYPTGYPNNLPNGKISTTITAIQNPAISLEKTGTPAATSKVGTVITYTYTITNTGNVTLDPPFTVTDDRITVNCSSATAIAPYPQAGYSTTCTGTDVVVDTDIDVGSKVNNAYASVVYKSSTVISNTDQFIVLTPPILLAVTPPAIVTLPGIGTYSFRMDNDTNYDATGVNIIDTRVTVDPGCPTTIASNTSITCTGTYNFTQADIDAGVSVSSTTRVTATMNSKAVSSNPVTVDVGITQNKSLTAEVVGTPSDSELNPGDTILYTYTLTNTGNVTLKTPFAVTDNIGTTITCADPSDFAPGTLARDCTGTYTVTAADVTAGSVKSTGTASATFNNGTPEIITASPVSAIMITFNLPRFNISVSANPTIVTALNTPVIFTYTFTNTGGLPLSPPYTVTSSLSPITLDCSLALNPLNQGESTSCTGTYTVTTNGDKTNNVIDATILDPSSNIVQANNLPQSAVVNVFICSPSTVTLSAPSANPASTMTWTVVNNSGSTIHIATIHFGWPTNRRLQTVTFASPNTTIYSASPGDNVGDRTFAGSWTIAAGATATVSATFNNSTTVSDFSLTFTESNCSGVWSNP